MRTILFRRASQIKQPLVLSAEDVARFLEAVPTLRDRVALVTAYAAGLRVGEVSRLKPSAIDSKRMLILITGGKGGKDRYVMLSPRLLSILRSYWCLAKPRPGVGCFRGAGSRRSGQRGRHAAGGVPQGSPTCRSR